MCDSNDNKLVLTTLYQANRANQDLYMNHQWKIFHFTMIAHSVIYFLCGTVEKDVKYGLLFISFWIMVLSLCVLWDLECSLDTTREIDLTLRGKNKLGLINDILKESGVSVEKKSEKNIVFWILWILEIVAFLILGQSIPDITLFYFVISIPPIVAFFAGIEWYNKRKCKK
jgi:hypothetical protein